jgi:hypothetical protein
MPQLRLEIPVALRPELKRDYECSTIPVDQLAARAGMSGRTFTARIRELGWLPRRVDLRGHRLPMLPPAETAKAEGIARTLAALARTLQEAMRLEEQARAQPQYSNNDDVPRDFDELRRRLSQRLEALVAEQESEISQRP